MHDAAEAADLDLCAAIEERRMKALTQRLRFIALAAMTVIGMLIVASTMLGEALPAAYTPLRLLGFAAMIAFVVGSYRPGFVRWQIFLGWLLVLGLASLAAWGGARRGNPAISAILESMLVLLTAAVIPWGVRMQAIAAGTCAALLAVVAWDLGPFHANDPDMPVLVDATAAMLVSLFVAHATRRTFDVAAEENIRLHAARARIRSLADQLDAKVRSRTAELEATLADQRALTRAISHDLRQPLRHIDGFTQMLRADLAEKLDDSQRDQMARVCRATARMDRMVAALLEISRVAGKPLELERVDMSAIARDVGETLAAAEPERGVQLEVEQALVVKGDPGLVRNMLHELMANAWKFTRGREQPAVHVGRQNGAFFVRDNGSGFDMQHAARLFGTFERLHHPHEFPGDGVGLAIAARVARRHGGRIWADSSPGKGATFFFTLSTDAR